MDNQTDDELIELAKNKDDRAFQELMRRYVAPVFRFARQYAGNKEDAEDITQDSFFKAWKNLGRFKAGKALKPWLYTIVRNTALDYIKRRRTMAFSEFDDAEHDQTFAEGLPDTGPLPTQVFEQFESAAELESIMGALHPDHRMMIVMHYHEELTFEEIAVVMDRPMNTVKSWHRRALLKLKTLLRTKDGR